MVQKKDRLTVVAPVYNEESCVDKLIERLVALQSKAEYLEMDFILVNDGSKDKSLELLYNYSEKNESVKVIDLSRNFGHQIAVTAGLDYADADYVAIIDGDLQDPPELIEEMYKKAKEGFDVVYGQRQSRRGDSIFKKTTARLFYLFISKMCDVEIPVDTGDFRLISRKVLLSINKMREKHRFIRGMVPWVGFKSTPLIYDRDERYAGVTKYPLRKMIKFAIDSILSFTNTPIRLATYFGLIIIIFSFLGGLVILYLKFFTPYTVPGISAVILSFLLIGGFQIVMSGLIGEYIGRIFEESKKRPLYFINSTKNIDSMDKS